MEVRSLALVKLSLLDRFCFPRGRGKGEGGRPGSKKPCVS